MRRNLRQKWRPPLALIITGAMAGIVAVPVLAITYFRMAGNILSSKETAAIIVVLALVSAAILGFLLWRLVLRPVTALTRHARAMKTGRSDSPPPRHFGTPEFRALGKSVIDMGETLNNRATGLRAYADHVTHELKSPLTAISGAAELLQGAVDPADRVALAATVQEAAGRMEMLLADLRRHAQAGQRPDTGVADLTMAAAEIQDVRVEVRKSGTLPMPPEDLIAVLTQLAHNAAAHGADTLSLEWGGDMLRVQDNGRGVAKGNRTRIFDPFFTTTRAEGGTGMGLSIVSSMLAAHGGRIALVDSEQGACFEIVF